MSVANKSNVRRPIRWAHWFEATGLLNVLRSVNDTDRQRQEYPHCGKFVFHVKRHVGTCPWTQ